MKKYIILIFLQFLYSEMWSQDYHPLVKEGITWYCSRGYLTTSDKKRAFGTDYFYTIKGDTIIHGTNYKKLLICGNDTISEEDLTRMWNESDMEKTPNSIRYYAAIREEGRNVFWIRNEQDTEELLYNFNEGSTTYESYGMTAKVTRPLTIPINPDNNDFRNTYMCQGFLENRTNDRGYTTFFIAEGLGCDTEPFKPEEWVNDSDVCCLLNSTFDGKTCIFDWWEGTLGARYAYYLQNGIVVPSINQQPADIYDLKGHYLKNEPQHGVYIKAGKKVIK